VVVFLTDNITTPTKVVLSCFGLLVGLWQFNCRTFDEKCKNPISVWLLETISNVYVLTPINPKSDCKIKCKLAVYIYITIEIHKIRTITSLKFHIACSGNLVTEAQLNLNKSRD
jgi:hypothetical protein